LRTFKISNAQIKAGYFSVSKGNLIIAWGALELELEKALENELSTINRKIQFLKRCIALCSNTDIIILSIK
jgi:hypothetical protein